MPSRRHVFTSVFGCILLKSICLPNALLGQDGTRGEFTLADVVPTGQVEIEFLDIRMSARGQTLATKMQAALAKKQEWIFNYVKEVSEPGKPLPYHSNIGLTKEEYDEFLQASKNIKVAETGIKWKCDFTVSSDGIFTIVPVGHHSATLRSISISVRDNTASASNVSLGRPEWVRPVNDSALGPWRGYLWKKTQGTFESIAAGEPFSLTELEVLHRIGTDKLMFRYKFQAGRDRKNTESQEFMFQVASPILQQENLSTDRRHLITKP